MIDPNTEITLVSVNGKPDRATAECRRYEELGYQVLSVAFAAKGFLITLRGPKHLYLNYEINKTLYQVGPFNGKPEAEQAAALARTYKGVRDVYITARREHTREFIGSQHA
jgi:hypothetical protein